MEQMLNKSWLVQRIRKPIGDTNPFSFGGGLRNGGFTEETAEMLSEVWAWDYMGAAEYERGAVPKTLEKMFDNKDNLVCDSFTTVFQYEHWKNKNVIEGEATIYYLCLKEHEEEIKKRIAHWAMNIHNTRDKIGLAEALGVPEEYDVCGWLELNNGFLFFTDETMWGQTCELFGVKIPISEKKDIKDE